MFLKNFEVLKIGKKSNFLKFPYTARYSILDEQSILDVMKVNEYLP